MKILGFNIKAEFSATSFLSWCFQEELGNMMETLRKHQFLILRCLSMVSVRNTGIMLMK